MTDPDKPFSRLPPTSTSADQAILDEIYDNMRARGRHVLNIHRVVGHAPRMLRAQATYATTMRDESSLARAFQELIILRVAQLNQAHYEASVHRRVARAVGLPTEKVDAIGNWRESSIYDARERAALAFIDQMATTGEVDDAVFDAARAAFSLQEIIEIAAVVAWYVGNSRFARAMRIVPEAE